MKLSLKIFLGIFIPLIISIVVISSILIYKSFLNDFNNERNRCIQEFNIIEKNIENSINQGTAREEVIIKSYADYYKENNLYFIYYNNNQETYNSSDSIELDDLQLLNVEKDKVNTQSKKINKNHYLLISTRINNDSILIYVRNMDSIYNIRNNLIKLSIVLIIIISFIVAIISYIISKTLTKPLVKMKNEMNKLSKGEFDIKLKEGKSEFGSLAKSFNKMSEELKNRDDELKDLITSKQLFIDNLSHEINTPLTTILGYSELLERTNYTDEQRMKFAIKIKNETLRIKNIHKNLLLLSYKKNSDFKKEILESQYVFNEIKKVVKIKVKSHEINLIINNRIKEFYGDFTLIVMCISNLISNAVDASENGSKIIVDSYEDDKNVYIKVIDEGHGISKENIEKIKEPFYRVDKARSRKNGGAGLGLAICTSIMEMHNGNMKIESELGKGSTFYLEFPKNLQL